MTKCKFFVASGRTQKFAVLSQRSSGAWQVRKSHVQRWCSEPKKLSIAAVGVTRAVRLRVYRSCCYYQTSYVRPTIVCEANLFSFLIVCECHPSHEGRSWRPWRCIQDDNLLKFDLQFFYLEEIKFMATENSLHTHIPGLECVVMRRNYLFQGCLEAKGKPG